MIADKGDENRGKEYDYVEDWGEQLVGKSQTVIVRLDLNTGKAVVFARKGCGVEKDNPNVHKVCSLALRFSKQEHCIRS